MSKISPCLWYDGEAEEAARFYVSLLPDSRIVHVQKNVADGPAGKKGTVLVVDFVLAGQSFMAMNGGCRFEYTHAVSFKVDCDSQKEVDRLWDALAEGGAVEQCGWLSRGSRGYLMCVPAPGRRSVSWRGSSRKFVMFRSRRAMFRPGSVMCRYQLATRSGRAVISVSAPKLNWRRV